MMLPSASARSVVVVTIIITMLKPSTAGLGTFFKIMNGKSVTCYYTNCTSDPICADGYNNLSSINDGCPFFYTKKYCCKKRFEPQCFFTGCNIQQSCPPNYLKLDRTSIGCSEMYDQAYCCKATDLPNCFDLTCSAAAVLSEPVKSCPPEYVETKRVKGPSGGCVSDLAERATCCKRMFGNSGNQRSGNAYNGAVVLFCIGLINHLQHFFLH